MTVEQTHYKVELLFEGVKVYNFKFKIFNASDLIVTLIDSDGIESILTIGDDYKLQFDGSYQIEGGTVEIINALLTGETLRLERQLPITQEVDWVNNDPMDMEILEISFDRVIMILQEQEGYIDYVFETAFVHVGDWQPDTQYYKFNVVTYQEAYWSAKEDHISGPTFEEEKWTKMIDYSQLQQYVDDAEAAAARAETAANRAENAADSAEDAEASTLLQAQNAADCAAEAHRISQLVPDPTTGDPNDLIAVNPAGDAYVLVDPGPGGGGVFWGSIAGTLSDQLDLQAALNAKTDDNVFNAHVEFTDENNPHQNARWRGPWTSVEYYKDDMVYDDSWLMIANKQTTDRAAPQPQGDVVSEFGGTDPGFVTQTELSETVLIAGQRYSAGDAEGWVTGISVFSPVADPNVELEVWVVADPEGTPASTFLAKFATPTIGWYPVTLTEALIPPGTVFDVFMYITNSSVGSASFSETWTYKRTNGTPSAESGEIWHQNNNREMRISRDAQGGNQQTNLANMDVGDLITAGGITWTITEVLSRPNGGLNVDVTPQSRAQEGDYTVLFEYFLPGTIPYARKDGHYAGRDIQGFYNPSGSYSGIVFDTNAYGIDVYFQPALVSDDWDLMSRVGGGSGGGGGDPGDGIPDAPIDNSMYARKNGIWSKTGQNVVWVNQLAAPSWTGNIGEGYRVDSTAQNQVMLMPASPLDGERVGIMDVGGVLSTNKLTLGRNGNNIMGLNEDMDITQDWVVVVFEFHAANSDWRVVYKT